MTSTVQLGEMSWPQVRTLLEKDPLVAVPVGAFEQHGHHLPLQVDAHLSQAVTTRAAEKASLQGRAIAVTPAVWTGYSPHHRDFPGTVTLDDTAFSAIVGQIARSLWHSGFRRIVLVNGHGGNAHLLRNLTQTLRYDHGISVAAASYWDFAVPDIADWRQSPIGGINHACEMETALVLATRPDLVDMDKARDHYLDRSRYLGADLVAGGSVTTAASFAELSETGVIGAPTLADADRGAALLEILTDRLAAFFADYAAWPKPEDLGDRS
ncbi:creatininase family protein [Pelagibacterium montanilacus]|uniref:creatininase family protein n=1 Tax=Pelagibacterium montanilacus TaxID=2185280 RepID=UPI000F8F148A|nr:creatininase family protein [Pelagibacterium montanilacus]